MGPWSNCLMPIRQKSQNLQVHRAMYRDPSRVNFGRSPLTSNADHEEALTEFALQRIDAINRAAWEAFINEEDKAARELWRQALEIAMSIDDFETEMAIRCRYGYTLAYRPLAAVETLAPILQARDFEDNSIVYEAMTMYLRAAIKLPLE